jgi:hypothetical protein
LTQPFVHHQKKKTFFDEVTSLLQLMVEENLVKQGQGCMVDVLRLQSVVAAVPQHCGQ